MKKTKRGLRKTLLLVSMFALILGSSVVTYAYWAGKILAPEDKDVNDNSVQIGEGEDVQTVITAVAVASEEELIPTAYATDGEDKETLTFAVTWAGNGATGATGTLEVIISNIKINEQDINGHGLGGANMFNITVTSPQSITAGTEKTIEILVTFAVEPKDLATYGLVANKEVTFDVTFKVTVTPN